MYQNVAAWLTSRNAPLEVRDASYTSPRENEIVVRNCAVAVNPFDWIIQAAPGMICSWMKFPYVLGSDVAGDVVEAGSGVTRFRVGDRVLGHSVGVDQKRNSVAEGAFQNYTVVLAHMAAPSPPHFLLKKLVFFRWVFPPLPVASFRKTIWRSSIQRRMQSRMERRFLSGVDQRASEATQSSLPWRPGVK